MPITKAEASIERTENRAAGSKGLHTLLYLLALVASISVWFLPIHAPLWLDETGTYWMISGGLHRIWAYRIVDLIFPAYYYLLWAWTRIFGHSEVILRSFSILAMLTAAWFVYLAAREIFNRQTSLIAVILFSLHFTTFYVAVDVRPYACAVTAVSLAIYLLLRLRRTDSLALAALFGLAAALPVWFHTLWGTYLPALLIAFFLIKFPSANPRAAWKQLAAALATFFLAFLPLIPGILYLFHTSGAHVYAPAPTFFPLYFMLAPGWLPIFYLAFGLVALVIVALKPHRQTNLHLALHWTPSLRLFLAFVLLGSFPVLIPWGVSRATPIHFFVSMHCAGAIPGLALAWAWLIDQLRPRILHLPLCLALVTVTATSYWLSPKSRKHDDSWKYALQLVEAHAAPTHSPVLICSDYPEADYQKLPSGPANDSRFLAQLSYYKLTVPAYVLPRSLNSASMQIGSQFLHTAIQKHKQLFAVAYYHSYPTLAWLTRQASDSFRVTDLGTFDGVKVLEFTPRPTPEPPSNPSQKLVKPHKTLTH